MSHSQICVSGDVTIHPSAVIAPGVLLQADSNSRIVIAAGACIGMGTILHADQGTLEVGESANIGTGVLFIGSGNIGAHACIGSSCTIFNTDVPKQHVLPSGSLLGDTSRQIQTEVPQQVEVTEAERIQVERAQTNSIKTEAPQSTTPQVSPELILNPPPFLQRLSYPQKRKYKQLPLITPNSQLRKAKCTVGLMSTNSWLN